MSMPDNQGPLLQHNLVVELRDLLDPIGQLNADVRTGGPHARAEVQRRLRRFGQQIQRRGDRRDLCAGDNMPRSINQRQG